LKDSKQLSMLGFAIIAKELAAVSIHIKDD
jgi:hypothetical protein